MSKIAKLIKQKCPEGVEYKSIKDVIQSLKTGLNPRQNFVLNANGADLYYVTGKDIQNNSINVSERTDLVSQDVVNLINKRANLEVNDVLFVSTGTGTVGRMAVINEYNNDWAVSETVFCLKPQIDIVLPNYLMYALYTRDAISQYEPRISKGSVPHLKVNDLFAVKIPIPPIEVQQEIVCILNKFIELEMELRTELETRKKQYEHYMSLVLLSIDNSKEYNLEDVCQIIDCPHTSPQWRESGIPVIRNYNLVNGKIDVRNMSYVSEEEYAERTKRVIPAENDILFSREAPIGNVGIVPPNFKCCQGQRVVLLRPKTNLIDPKFLIFLLQGPLVKQQIDLVTHKGATVSNFNISDLKQLKLIVPPLTEQGGAVSVLKRFDDLCNDYTNGLPAEIEARKKQYEYYRDSLISFKRFGE